MKAAHGLRKASFLVVALVVLAGVAIGGAPVFAATGTATSSATPDNAAPDIGNTIVATINIDVSGVNAPDNKLGSFTGTLDWDPAVLSYSADSGILGGFTGNVNTSDVATGHIVFNGANPSGATGNTNVLTVTLDAIGGGTSALDLQYTAMAAATTFANLLPLLTVNDGVVVVSVPVTCYVLTRTHTGTGSDPTANPGNSNGCPSGQYVAGAVVGLTASPGSGWTVGSWSGTDNNSSTSASNQVTMPAAARTVTVNYVEVPDTIITDHPDDPSLSTNASFGFTSTVSGSTFECQLDGGGFSACSSPQIYTGLDYGDHTFEVRAIDGAGNPDPTPASYGWTIYRPFFVPLVMS